MFTKMYLFYCSFGAADITFWFRIPFYFACNYWFPNVPTHCTRMYPHIILHNVPECTHTLYSTMYPNVPTQSIPMYPNVPTQCTRMYPHKVLQCTRKYHTIIPDCTRLYSDIPRMYPLWVLLGTFGYFQMAKIPKCTIVLLWYFCSTVPHMY